MDRMWTTFFCASLGVVISLTACKQAHPPHTTSGAPLRVTFDDSDAVPAGWTVAETNARGTPGKWTVTLEPGGASEARALRLAETKNSGSTFNLLLSTETYAADLRMRVRVRADRGREDQGGGLLWRARDADNYYVTRWNPLEDNLRLYKVVDGKRSMLASASVSTDARAWHLLEIEAWGTRTRISLDGKELLVHEDTTFTNGGHVGFWTKADAATSFDDLEVEALSRD